MPQKSVMIFWFSLYLFVPPIILWVWGMTGANKIARRINVQLDYLEQTLNSPSSFKRSPRKEVANLCVSCWLSGDCDRERKAIEEREVVTHCRGYFSEDK